VEFLERVRRSAFANPFSETRDAADAALMDVEQGAPRLNEVTERVSAFLARLREERRERSDAYGDEDRERLALAHLFDVFHGLADSLDALIRRQLGAGDASIPVPFAAAALKDLAARGFTEDAAVRYFAMFYQLRRAFHFIAASLTGGCPSMRQLRCSLWANVFTMDMPTYERHLLTRMEDFSTLLLGETGTGKGAAAAAIGRSGFIPFLPREGVFAESFTRSFLSIHLAQFPETLIESELFGHRKGAFTGAVESHEGVFSRCSPYGSIFLDEIADASVPVQIKLLKVLQERTFSPVGSHETKRFSGRVIAASNRSLTDLRRRGLFRDDFYYRLCSDTIVVPPLRQRVEERPEELSQLAGLILERLLGAPDAALAQRVVNVIRRDLGPAYAWPGNVRELEQRVRQVLLKSACDPAPEPEATDLGARLKHAIDNGAATAQELIADYCAVLHRRCGTYEEVARRAGLDRRTVRKHVLDAQRRAARPGDAGAQP
jgi:DNA-binding NtrC family response regulator